MPGDRRAFFAHQYQEVLMKCIFVRRWHKTHVAWPAAIVRDGVRADDAPFPIKAIAGSVEL
jgi:hypothetical protein